jgi:ribosomal protein S18 acetylase RimI-like enzyme
VIERPATRDDLPAIVELYCRYDERYRGGPDTDTGDVTGDWDSPGFDLADKTLVLEQDGAVVGYAVVDDDGDADTVTALDRPELDGRLVDWLEARGTALAHYAPDSDRALNALFDGRGWQPTRRFWRMRIEHTAAPPRPVWPPGVQVRDYDRPADDRATHALITEAFAEIGGQRLRPFEQWCSSLLDTEKYDASLYLVAEQDGEIVGAALSQDTGDYGFVRQLAVAPAQRGRGVALALLHECFRRHAARGLPATQLGVDAGNPTGALVLYERAGMQVNEQFTRWEKPAKG